MSEEDTVSGRGRSQQLGRMGEYAVMAQLLSKSWIGNVYSPAADTGVDLVILTKEQKLRKIQVKTSRIYPTGGSWFNNISQRHLKEDSTQPDMFYVLAEGHPPTGFLVFRAQELLKLFQSQFVGTCQGRLVKFEAGFPLGKKFQLRHRGSGRGGEALLRARVSTESIDKCWNNWDLLR
ncbi:MAG TPA: hypothetical protein VFE98_02855 [Candidatus Bathyarchaeia archaeon]|nr:hypothetical protein [Candidatus Bathyarchaeia archaeon]